MVAIIDRDDAKLVLNAYREWRDVEILYGYFASVVHLGKTLEERDAKIAMMRQAWIAALGRNGMSLSLARDYVLEQEYFARLVLRNFDLKLVSPAKWDDRWCKSDDQVEDRFRKILQAAEKARQQKQISAVMQ